MEARKEEFRQYLEDSGVISALTKALIRLYEMKYERPESAVAFLQEHLSDDFPTMAQYQNLLNELNETKAKLAALKSGTEAANTTDAPPVDSNATTDVKAASPVDSNATTDVKAASPDDPIQEAKNLLEKLHNDASCKSLLKSCLTIDLFDQLKDKKTASGKTLIDCISSGLRHPESSIGVYAADGDAYTIFKELFDPIIDAYHEFANDKTHPQDADGWDGNVDYFQNLDPNLTYIKSIRIRCARSLENFPLNPAMTETNYLDLMKQVQSVLEALTDDLEGTFYPLEGMAKDEEDKLIADHQLFKSDDENLKDAGALNWWPKGRGIFKNKDDTFLVWVNEEDHLRFISMDKDGDIKKSYSRLKEAVTKCSSLKFKKDNRLGWITFCPTNLGSTIRASVMIHLPKLTAAGTLKDLADQNNLQIRGTHGENSKSVDGIHEISNKRRLGLTEYDAVKEMYDGIKIIIEAEENTP